MKSQTGDLLYGDTDGQSCSLKNAGAAMLINGSAALESYLLFSE